MATMTLNMPDNEMAVLEELSAQIGMDKTAAMRKALRLMQLIHVRQRQGERMFFEGDKSKVEIIIIGLGEPMKPIEFKIEGA